MHAPERLSPVGDVPANAAEHCPGTESEDAGKATACAGCPNQAVCASARPRGPDPAVAEVAQRLSDVAHKILVLSGKGGVGKTTVAAQLAFALAADEAAHVAVVDADITGPSVPLAMGLVGEQVHRSNVGWSPVYAADNIGVMSIGFLLPSADDAVIWRGPKKNGLIKQFLRDVDWGPVDFMIVDTPPGTSDEHLSVVTYLAGAGVDGAIVVTTPQEVALCDVRRELTFCRKVGIRVLGVVENMSGFVCPDCKTESDIFPPTTGGAAAMAREYAVPYLGRIPLDPTIGRCSDQGLSVVAEAPTAPSARAYQALAESVRAMLGEPVPAPSNSR